MSRTIDDKIEGETDLEVLTAMQAAWESRGELSIEQRQAIARRKAEILRRKIK